MPNQHPSRRSFTKAVLATPFVLRAQNSSLHARVKLDPGRVVGEIDPMIYGNFAEHLGRCIEGGIFDEGSPLADAKGYRKDVMKAAKDLNVTLLRWPGGNFSSNYHWQDGNGPRGWNSPGAQSKATGSARTSSWTTRACWEPSRTSARISARGRGARRSSGSSTAIIPKGRP
jgi:hypothetical protein